MSFRETPSAVGMCNRALSRIAQQPIATLEPPSPQGEPARQCALWYKKTVARLLSTHHWGLATKRATLAQLEVDRSDWLYQFAVPDDMAFPVDFSFEGSGSGIQYYRGLGGLVASRMGRHLFLVSGRSIYSNISGPFNYVSLDITEADFTEPFAEIVELVLASRIAFPITKNAKLVRELKDEAQGAMNLAITQNLNQGNPTYGNEISERDLARGSWPGGREGLPWDWWPGQ